MFKLGFLLNDYEKTRFPSALKDNLGEIIRINTIYLKLVNLRFLPHYSTDKGYHCELGRFLLHVTLRTSTSNFRLRVENVGYLYDKPVFGSGFNGGITLLFKD